MPNWQNDLDSLYGYMLRRMMEANLKNDTDALIEVKKLLADLRATWAQAIDLNKKEMREAAGFSVSGKWRHGGLQTAGGGDVRWTIKQRLPRPLATTGLLID